MRDINYIKQIINNRICCIVLPGKSVENLESYITEIVDYSICWCGLGAFPVLEDNILSRTNAVFDIILDCATVPEARIIHYEKYARLPRLLPYLKRDMQNAWITTHGLIRDSVIPYYPQVLKEFENKIVKVDSFFPEENISKWMDVPNSVTFLIASLLAGGASKIVIFGLDGYKGDLDKGTQSYYKPEHVIEERLHAHGLIEDSGINRDTDNFLSKFPSILEEYRQLFNNDAKIYNCSPNSIYEVPQKINYNQLKEKLSE